jgi:hypothetical protein
MIAEDSISKTARGAMDTGPKYRFDPVDHNFMRIRGRLSPGERLLAMLAARDWVMGAQRARLHRQHPGLSFQEINLKVLEEIERAERRQARPHPVS